MKLSGDWFKYQPLEQLSSKKIETGCSQPTFHSKLEKIWQFLVRHLRELPELRVWHTCDDEGNIWWNAYDPTTNRSIYSITEEQMRVWIEQRYYSHF